jgi:AraC-like DNA-binding protein
MTRLEDQLADDGIGQFTKLAQGSIATLVAFRHHSHPHRDPHDEVFDSPTIIFTPQGHWHVRSLNERAMVDRDTIVYGRAGQHYRCRHDEEVPRDRNVALDFNELTLAELLSRYPVEEGHAILDPRTVARTLIPARLPVISRLQGFLLTEATRKETASPLKLDLVALDLLVEITRLFGPARAGRGAQNRRDRDKITAAQAYMASHLSEDVDLAALSRAAELSPFHFSRVFKARTGTSPHRYLISLRIEQAARLLRSSPLPVTQVCYDVGFRNLSHFITTFRSLMGVTPSRYRQQ